MIRLIIHTLWASALVLLSLLWTDPIKRLGDGMVWQAQEMKAVREAKGSARDTIGN